MTIIVLLCDGKLGTGLNYLALDGSGANISLGQKPSVYLTK